MNTKESVLLFKSKEASSKTWAFVWLTCMLTDVIVEVVLKRYNSEPSQCRSFCLTGTCLVSSKFVFLNRDQIDFPMTTDPCRCLIQTRASPAF